MKPEMVTWEVRSLKGQDEVNSGAKWQATKMEEVKTKDSESNAGKEKVLSVESW